VKSSDRTHTHKVGPQRRGATIERGRTKVPESEGCNIASYKQRRASHG
jgi:hypothetical protein